MDIKQKGGLMAAFFFARNVVLAYCFDATAASGGGAMLPVAMSAVWFGRQSRQITMRFFNAASRVLSSACCWA